MEEVTINDLKKLYVPPKGSHKGDNGKLTIIGGSHLFHGASLWALKVASRIVDMVFYASVPQNNELTKKLSSELYDFIAVPRSEIEQYIEESDAVLIGPGMVRIPSTSEESLRLRSGSPSEVSFSRILSLKDEGEQTYWLTKYLLQKYPEKKWIIDAGALQMMKPEWLNKNCLVTPHQGEFEKLFCHSDRSPDVTSGRVEESHKSELVKKVDLKEIPRLPLVARDDKDREDDVLNMAKKYGCTILLKGETDIICGPGRVVEDRLRPDVASGLRRVKGGNAGMTKGGTGDVLAGLVAALACKNDLFTAACGASYINKKAGEELYKRVGYYFNASDLADQIPQTMKEIIG